MNQFAQKLKETEELVALLVRQGQMIRQPATEEWAAIWSAIKNEPHRPALDLIRQNAGALIKKPANNNKDGHTCKQCGGPLSPSARKCPHCGHTYTTPGGVLVAIIVGVVFGLIFLGFF